MPRTLPEPLSIRDALRFWTIVDKREDGCWRFMRKGVGRDGRTYTFHVQGRQYSARRIAWELERPDRPLTTKVRLLATCRNPWCVNPDHMRIAIGGGILPREKCHRGHDFTEENTYFTT
ncbi:MAG TPA: hypothetical protein VH080_03595, partial [Gemmatimonadaceae bacterium]|nr:hypothetical protein [Gemmatimonadaceae bacterium]